MNGVYKGVDGWPVDAGDQYIDVATFNKVKMVD